MFSALLFTWLMIFSPTLQQPEAVAARFNRAVELQRQGQWEEAAAEYRALLAIAPNYPEALANLGAVLARLRMGLRWRTCLGGKRIWGHLNSGKRRLSWKRRRNSRPICRDCNSRSDSVI